MQRSDFSYKPLSETQYEPIITAMEVFKDGAGNTIRSPLHGHDNWASAEAGAKARDVDLRALLAALLLEDHGGTDPEGGVALARVFNFGGIKFVTPAPDGWYDSGIPCPPNEGGTYAGFRDFGSFILALIDTLENEYCGPAFKAGDLAGAWAIYVGGPNNPNHAAGQDRVNQWQYYVQHFPPQGGGTPVPDQGIYSEDTVNILRKHIGESNSDGTLDPWNMQVYPNHPWADFCEAADEGADVGAGLSVVHRGSALEKLNAVTQQGLLQTSWPPEHGANCLWGADFDSQGHVCKWDADQQMFLTTIVRPSSIGYFYSDFWRQAMKGWFRPIGVAGVRRAAPVPVPAPQSLVIPADNPYNAHITEQGKLIGFGGGFKNKFVNIPDGLTVIGFPIRNEEKGVVRSGTTFTVRTVQFCERAVLVYQPENPPPYDVIVMLRTDEVLPL